MSIHTSSYKDLDLHVQMYILLLAQNSPNTRAEWIDQRFFFSSFDKRQFANISTLLQESI